MLPVPRRETPAIQHCPSDNPGDTVHGHLTAEDLDNDVLSFSAAGLPTGVRMNSRGHLQGETSVAGKYTVMVDVLDDHYQVSSECDWTVGDTESAGPRKGGAIDLLMLMAGVIVSEYRTLDRRR